MGGKGLDTRHQLYQLFLKSSLSLLDLLVGTVQCLILIEVFVVLLSQGQEVGVNLL
jgi:hypothetical protein